MSIRELSGSLLLTAALNLTTLIIAPTATPAEASQKVISGVIGMYVHQHWPYKHPYAARTWTLEDWRGYAGGLKKIGYNTIMIWPMLETMPEPLTPSDRTSLEKHARVIEMLHHELGMRVFIVLCPNIIANKDAANATYETRHFYWSDTMVDPGDPEAVRKMIARREKLFEYLKAADGVAIIDSDPGGYPNCSNAQFVSLLKLHREMLNRLRSGIELDYWVHIGWQAWNHFDATGILQRDTEANYLDTLSRLKEVNPEPWGLANGLQYAEKLNLGSRVISYNYGRIEAEPSLPMTNFGGDAAYDGGSHPGPRGVMGNAQTHCVQLPNTFAFARGALEKPATDSDYAAFADRLLPGHGKLIVGSWKALAATDTAEMRAHAQQLRSAENEKLELGDLQGLLFGSGQRFVNDLALQLDLRAAFQDFVKASTSTGNMKPAFAKFVAAADAWENQQGYQGHWSWPGMYDALRRLHSPDINSVLTVNICLFSCPEGAHPTGPKDVETYFAQQETFTPRLLAAMKKKLAEMRN
jgi:hypothetical protein